MSQHTPGPWQWGAHPREDIARVYAPEQPEASHTVADVYECADAYLIAAAPDLLAACEALVAFEAHNHPCPFALADQECALCNALALRASDLLRPAIRKARGRVQP